MRGPGSDFEGMPTFGGWGEEGGRAWEGAAREVERMPALQVCVRVSSVPGLGLSMRAAESLPFVR